MVCAVLAGWRLRCDVQEEEEGKPVKAKSTKASSINDESSPLIKKETSEEVTVLLRRDCAHTDAHYGHRVG